MVGRGLPPESPFAYLRGPEVRAWYAFMKVQLRLRYEMNQRLRADAGISLADYDVLVALTSEDDGTLTVTDLATRIGAERSRVSHRTRSLADRRMVVIAPHPDDRRATAISLTDEARAVLRRASPRHIEFVRSVFFGALDEAEVEQLAGVFERVYDRVIDNGTLPRPADHP